jgi:hypothetical protein
VLVSLDLASLKFLVLPRKDLAQSGSKDCAGLRTDAGLEDLISLDLAFFTCLLLLGKDLLALSAIDSRLTP